jgi:protein-S-isoprenylcysteine O-methyltransferase Ste14
MSTSLAMQANMLLVLASLGLVQLYLERTTEKRNRYPEGVVRHLQYVLGVPALVNLVLFSLDPDIWTNVFVPVSRYLEVVGGVVFNVAALTILWAHLALRRSWSAELETRPDHRLVETGPYRWIRHPLYSSYLLVTGGLFLMTGNWLVGGSMFAYFLAVAARAWKEEEMLLDRLGHTYLAYMTRTNRFLPSPFRPIRAGLAYLRPNSPK